MAKKPKRKFPRVPIPKPTRPHATIKDRPRPRKNGVGDGDRWDNWGFNSIP